MRTVGLSLMKIVNILHLTFRLVKKRIGPHRLMIQAEDWNYMKAKEAIWVPWSLWHMLNQRKRLRRIQSIQVQVHLQYSRCINFWRGMMRRKRELPQ